MNCHSKLLFLIAFWKLEIQNAMLAVSILMALLKVEFLSTSSSGRTRPVEPILEIKWSLISFCLYEYLIFMKEKQTLRVYFYEANILIHSCLEHVEIPLVHCISNTAQHCRNKNTMIDVAAISFSIKFGTSIMLGWDFNGIIMGKIRLISRSLFCIRNWGAIPHSGLNLRIKHKTNTRNKLFPFPAFMSVLCICFSAGNSDMISVIWSLFQQ